MKSIVLCFFAILLSMSSPAYAMEGTGKAVARSGDAVYSATMRAGTANYRTKCRSCVRDGRGRIRRSSWAKREFMERTGYPRGRPGYVVDHIIPLACGGRDGQANMQWQTQTEAKAKDKIERKECGGG